MASEGEGSRGGKVIRHTKGGHAIYDPGGRNSSSSMGTRIGKVAAYAAGGVATTALGGMAAGKIARTSANIENKAKDLARIAGKGVNAARKSNIGKFMVRHQIVQDFLEKSHTGTRIAVAALGGGLIYKAASSAIDGTSYDTKENGAKAALGAGIASAVLTRGFEGSQLAHSARAAWDLAIRKAKKPLG